MTNQFCEKSSTIVPTQLHPCSTRKRKISMRTSSQSTLKNFEFITSTKHLTISALVIMHVPHVVREASCLNMTICAHPCTCQYLIMLGKIMILEQNLEDRDEFQVVK